VSLAARLTMDRMQARRQPNGSIPNLARVGNTFFGRILCAGIVDARAAERSVSVLLVVPVCAGAGTRIPICHPLFLATPPCPEERSVLNAARQLPVLSLVFPAGFFVFEKPSQNGKFAE